MVPTRYLDTPAARARFGDRIDRLAPWLLRVDPLADAAAEALAAQPGARRLLERALEQGSASEPGLPAPVQALLAQAERVPAWVDWPTLDRGGEVLLRAGAVGGLVLAMRSLVLGYCAPAGNKPLALSGRLREQAPRRLNETARFVVAVCAPGGVRPGAEGYRITLKVRLMHAQVRRLAAASGRWREAEWGAPINQHDMAATSLLFGLSVVDGLRQLGATISAEEAERYLQLWRYVGLLMGVEPELLCGSEPEARRLAELIEATQGPPDSDSAALTRALLDVPLARARTPAQRRRAEARVAFTTGLCRTLVGDVRADALGLPRDAWRFAARALRAGLGPAELARAHVPGVGRLAVQAGERYWDWVVRVGLGDEPATFELPERPQVRSSQ